MKILFVSCSESDSRELVSNSFLRDQVKYLGNHMIDECEAELFSLEYSSKGLWKRFAQTVAAHLKFLPKLFNSYDVIHFHNIDALTPLHFLYRTINPDVKLFLTYSETDFKNEKKSRGYKDSIYRYVFENINGIIVPNLALAESLWLKYEIQSQEFIPKGISKNSFFPMPVIEKRYDLLIHADDLTEEVVPLFKDALSVYAGDLEMCVLGEIVNPLLVAELEAFIKIDYKEYSTLDELRITYNQTRFAMHFSELKDYDLLISQAMYCGVPVMVNSDGGIQNQVVNGINGFIFSLNQAWGFSEVLEWAFSSTPEEYKELSKSCISSNFQFSLSHVCDKLLNTYSKEEFQFRNSHQELIA